MFEFLTYDTYFLKHLVVKYGRPYVAVVDNFNKLSFAINSFLYCFSIYTKCKQIIYITSGYRPKEYNKSHGGSQHSLHIKAMAVDIMPKELQAFIFFLRSDIGKYALKTLGLYYYIGYSDKKGIEFIHFQLAPTVWANKETHQFWTKQYPRDNRYIV